MEDLVCKISGLVFENRSTGFVILRTVPEGKTGLTTFVKGSFPGVSITVGLKAKFNGKWDEHPTYGKQFSAATCELLPEKGRNGVVTYLASHVPSIGPITAGRLYNALGDELIQILETEPDRIRSLDFLKSAQADAIINEWKQASTARTTSIFLADLGLNAAQIKSVYTKYGVDTVTRVRDDAYCLYQCTGVGFTTADVAARKLGIGVDDERRVRAIVLYALNELSGSEGHVYGTTTQIYDLVARLFNKKLLESFSHGEYLSDSHYYAALTELTKQELIVCKDDRIYLSYNWVFESESAACLARMAVQEPRQWGNLEQILTDFEQKQSLQLADEQRQAFFMLDKSRVCVISGYPGTGKTLLVSAFVHLFEKTNLNYALLSPTGIAAKRLSQMTGKPASTIHRALGYGHDGEWEFNAANPFVVDAVIVDECSMVDQATFYHLISALPASTTVICVGDSAQLPSVGAGYVLNNLMHCPDISHVALTRIYRQSKQSDIIHVAHQILRGELVNTATNRDSEFVFFDYDRDQVIPEVCKMTSLMKEKGVNFQVIAPMYDGELGVNNLNIKLREVLNPEFTSGKAAKLKHGTVDIYEGDRVMVVHNDYDRMVFNGDVGKVQRISIKSDEIEVKIFDWFDQESSVLQYTDKVFTYKVEEARSLLRVAYACTCHKVQGNEFDYVILPMTMQYGFMLYRNLVYTAITRAKRKVFVLGDPKAFAYSVRNVRETVRNSDLSGLISRSIHDLKKVPAPKVNRRRKIA
jgi:exodeoxyribonuclease V alpha subunit